MAFRVGSALLVALLAVLVSYAAFLTFTYQYPRFAHVPDLHEGRVSLGYSTAHTQRVWIHCNNACRRSVCAQMQSHPRVEPARCTQSLRARLQARPAGGDSEAWLPAAQSVLVPAPLAPLQNVTVLELQGLQACTRYEYRASMEHHSSDAAQSGEDSVIDVAIITNTFRTAPRLDQPGCNNMQVAVSSASSADASDVAPVSPPPAPFGADVRLIWGSCLGLSPFSNIRPFQYLLDRAHREATDLVLLLGDTVYVDIPHMEDSTAYAQIYSDPAFASLFHRVPWVGTFDDHELVNDWSLADEVGDAATGTAAPHTGRFETGMRFFDEWVGAKNPPPNIDRQTERTLLAQAGLAPSRFDLPSDHPSATVRYFNFSYGALASVFVTDSRQYASPPEARGGPPDGPSRTKLGAVQLAQLKAWLLHTNSTFKFIANSTPWSSTAYKFVQDGWASYLHERDGLFDFIVDHNVTGVVLLSADLHWAGSYHFRRWNLHEVTVSPLQSFGLPHWNEYKDDEVEEYVSTWTNHAGQIELHAGGGGEGGSGEGSVATDPWLNITIFKYQYDQPKRHRSIILKASDLIHRPVDHPVARHEKLSWP